MVSTGYIVVVKKAHVITHPIKTMMVTQVKINCFR